jgi:hypothetical protein
MMKTVRHLGPRINKCSLNQNNDEPTAGMIGVVLRGIWIWKATQVSRESHTLVPRVLNHPD